MIVERTQCILKPGCMKEGIELLQEGVKLDDHLLTYRIYRPITGQFRAVVVETEYEDFEQYEKSSADTGSKPEWAQWLEKWHTVVDSDANREVLTLVE